MEDIPEVGEGCFCQESPCCDFKVTVLFNFHLEHRGKSLTSLFCGLGKCLCEVMYQCITVAFCFLDKKSQPWLCQTEGDGAVSATEPEAQQSGHPERCDGIHTGARLCSGRSKGLGGMNV